MTMSTNFVHYTGAGLKLVVLSGVMKRSITYLLSYLGITRWIVFNKIMFTKEKR